MSARLRHPTPPQRQKKDPVSPRLARLRFSPSSYIPHYIGYFVSHMAEQIPGFPARFLGPRSPHQLKATCVLRGLPLEGGVESRDQGLRQPEGEDKLGASHEELQANILVQSRFIWSGGDHTLGTRPLKKAEAPSFLAMLVRMRKPLSGLSKLRFWMRVLMTSRGADTTSDAEAPAIEAMKFWNHEALL